MSAAMRPKTVSIHDYPEHLNPFREDDHKPKFWTLGKRLSRSNSINFSGIKELKNSWALRSFMKKGKRREQPSPTSPPPQPPSQPTPKPVNGEDSPIVFRRAMMYSSMSRGRGGGPYNSIGGSMEHTDRYEYRGSVTPLPRSRFQERLRSTSQQEVSELCATPRMARSEVSGSRLSIESANPFDQDPTPPIKAPRRKKKRAPLPPADPDVAMQVIAEPTVVKITEVDEKNENHHGDQNTLKTPTTTELTTVVKLTEVEEKGDSHDDDSDIEGMHLDVELKIVEEDDLKGATSEASTIDVANNKENKNVGISSIIIDENQNEDNSKGKTTIIKDSENNNITKVNSEEDILKSDVLKSVKFSKVDIIKYRRNSSVDEDDIKLRRGNLEDFTLANKRSKSFSNACDPIYATYDISLNAINTAKDTNGNAQPQKVICKIYDDSSRKRSVEVSSTEKEILDIDKVRIEFEKEIRKLNQALEEDFSTGAEMSVSEIKKKYDKEKSSPNPIPKPRRSPELSKSTSPINGIHH